MTSQKRKSKAISASRSVAIYCRVSTHEQGKGDFSSLDSQETIIRKYCAEHGWKVFDVYADTKTGSTLERPELARLLRDATTGKFDVLAATKFDRVSRSVKDFLDLDDKLQSLGIGIVIVTQHIDTTTATGKMQRTMMLAFSEFEREMIGDRTREKLYTQAQKGYWGGGNIILGYDLKEKKLIVNAKESELVNHIFESYLRQPSTAKIAALLNSEGFHTKQRLTKAGKTTGGGSFNNQHVHDILRNRIYRGIVKYKGQEFRGLHEPIVSEDLFDRVQERLAQSRDDRRAAYDRSALLLLGITKCGFCGSNMTTSYAMNDGQRYLYYKCTSKQKFGADKCECRDIAAVQLERLVEQIVIHNGKDKSFFDAVFKQISVNESQELIDLRKKRGQLNGNLSKLNTEVKNLAGAIASSRTESGREALMSRLDESTTSVSAIRSELSSVERKIELIEEYLVPKDLLRKKYAEFAEVYSGLSSEKKKRLVQCIITEISCLVKKKEQKGQIRISFRGDGSVLQDWDIKENPETLVSRFRVAWLRE